MLTRSAATIRLKETLQRVDQHINSNGEAIVIGMHLDLAGDGLWTPLAYVDRLPPEQQ